MEIWISTFERRLPGIFPELFLFLAISILLLFGAFAREKGKGDKASVIISRPIAQVSVLVLFLTRLLVLERPFENQSLFHNRLILNPFTQFRKFVILGGGGFLIWIGLDYMKKERINAFEYIILILFACLGIILLVSAQDLIVLYLAIEMQSLSLYALAAFQRNSAFSTEAGLKYFILGAFSSGLLLFGSSIIYGFSGTTNFEEIRIFFSGIENLSPGICLGVLCISSALLFKISAAPFHAWAPDVYEGAPTSVRAFFAVLPKFAVLALSCRLFYFAFFDLIEVWQPILLISALLSIVVAAFSALYQRKLKRFFAYRSIGHVGYLLLGFGTGTIEGVQAVFVYLLIYLITSVCAWSFILALRVRQKNHSSTRPFYIRQLNGLGVTSPLLAFTFSILMFSIAGTPPLAGFVAKITIFFSAIERSLYGLAIIGVLTSVLSAFYYLRFIKTMYFDKAKSWVLIETIDKEKSFLLGGSFFFLVFFFIYPSPLLLMAHELSLWVLV
jgi:NADH-quinone oxidoreductase subunit N